MAKKSSKHPIIDLSKATQSQIDQIFEEAIRDGRGFKISDVFAPERIDVLAELMTNMGHPIPSSEIDQLKKLGEKN